MLVYGSIIIAVIIATILWLKHKRQIVWWEPLLIIGASAILAFGSKALIEYSQVTFTEYWGSEVVSVYEEEPYNYWHSETCTRSVPCGTDKDGNTEYCTETYDCSHQDDVGPSWSCETSIGETFSISEEQYDKWSAKFGGEKVAIDSRENYAPNDRCVGSSGTKFEGKDVGDLSYTYKVTWNGDYATSVPLTTKHSYENRVKASDYSVFNYEKITKKQVEDNHLYTYPKFDDYFSYPAVLGTQDKYAQEVIQRINGHLGPTKQVRVWVLLHYTDDANVAWLQENYWVGGNKNELVINIGVDSSMNVKWVNTFSWSTSAGLEDNITKYVKSIKKLDKTAWTALGSFLLANVEKDWVRLEFKQFDYLTVEPPLWTIILVYFLTIVVCIAVSIWVVRNEFMYNDEVIHTGQKTSMKFSKMWLMFTMWLDITWLKIKIFFMHIKAWYYKTFINKQ